MIAAVTTFFAVRNVILFLFDDHIAAFADDLHYLLDILYKLADNTDSCNILDLFLQLLVLRLQLLPVQTLEGLQEEAGGFVTFIADQGAEQCGFCNPGFIMNALALFREKEYPTEDEIKEYLAGNLCRCSGYEGQLRGIQAFLAWKRSKEAAE